MTASLRILHLQLGDHFTQRLVVRAVHLAHLSVAEVRLHLHRVVLDLLGVLLLLSQRHNVPITEQGIVLTHLILCHPLHVADLLQRKLVVRDLSNVIAWKVRVASWGAFCRLLIQRALKLVQDLLGSWCLAGEERFGTCGAIVVFLTITSNIFISIFLPLSITRRSLSFIKLILFFILAVAVFGRLMS